MLLVPVVSRSGKPLMPCHPARARELVRSGRAVRRFNKGIFYIKFLDRDTGDTQSVAIGVDPGFKKEGLTVKSSSHTFVNIQADAVDWVQRQITERRGMRRARRARNTPCRKSKLNRLGRGMFPSIRARWLWKLRICRWLAQLYPVSTFVVEDIRAMTTGKPRWDKVFSPIQTGKHWFYRELSKIARVVLKTGRETKALRLAHGLKKSHDKMAETFSSHCVDSWVLANYFAGGHTTPDLKRLLCITPLQLHRRQLHRLQPSTGGVRSPYGGSRSHGFKRGSLVKHHKWGLAYVGGMLKSWICLHDVVTGARLSQKVNPKHVQFLAYNSWRTRLMPAVAV